MTIEQGGVSIGSGQADSSNPLYMHPCNSPGTLTVSISFDGMGYRPGEEVFFAPSPSRIN